MRTCRCRCRCHCCRHCRGPCRHHRCQKVGRHKRMWIQICTLTHACSISLFPLFPLSFSMSQSIRLNFKFDLDELFFAFLLFYSFYFGMNACVFGCVCVWLFYVYGSVLLLLFFIVHYKWIAINLRKHTSAYVIATSAAMRALVALECDTQCYCIHAMYLCNGGQATIRCTHTTPAVVHTPPKWNEKDITHALCASVSICHGIAHLRFDFLVTIISLALSCAHTHISLTLALCLWIMLSLFAFFIFVTTPLCLCLSLLF